MSKRPKKWILNPDYTDQQRAEKMAAFEDYLLEVGGGSEHEVYFPERYDKDIPEEGCWIGIRRVPAVEIKVRTLDIYYALPEARLDPHNAGFPRHLARILTPDGEVWLWPYEYFKVGDVREYIGSEGVEVMWLNPDAAPPNEAIFYIMSRGISRQQAILMFASSVKDRNVFWLALSDGYRLALGFETDLPEGTEYTLIPVREHEREMGPAWLESGEGAGAAGEPAQRAAVASI